MKGYLGETEVDISTSIYKDYTPADWVMLFIERFGQIDGAHHKSWVLDQAARILKGTKVNVKLAKWENGEEEYRIEIDKPSEEYLNWVEEMKGEYSPDDDCFEYNYNKGIAP